MKHSESNNTVLSAWFNLEKVLKDGEIGEQGRVIRKRPQTSQLYKEYLNYRSQRNIRPGTAVGSAQLNRPESGWLNVPNPLKEEPMRRRPQTSTLQKYSSAPALRPHSVISVPVVNQKKPNMSPDKAYDYFNELHENKSILTVDLSTKDGINRNKVSARGCEPLETLLQSGHPLQILILKGCAITAAGFECILSGLRTNKTLQVLNVSSNNLSAEAASYVSTYLQSCSLIELDLSYNPIGNVGMDYLAPLFERSTFQLQRINFASCNIKSLGIFKLFTALTSNKYLDKLTLDNNDLHGNGFNHIEQVLISRIPLTYLSVAHCFISPDGAECIGNGLEKNKTLKTLIVKQNRIGDYGAEAIFKGLTIQKLDLKQCTITDKAAAGLAQLIRNSTQLSWLCLANNDFHDQSGILINEAARVNLSVLHLDVSENPVSYKYVDELSKIITYNKMMYDKNKIPNLNKQLKTLEQYIKQKNSIEKEDLKNKEAILLYTQELEKTKQEKEIVKMKEVEKTNNMEQVLTEIMTEKRHLEAHAIRHDSDLFQALVKLDDECNDLTNQIQIHNATSTKLMNDLKHYKDQKQMRKSIMDPKLEAQRRIEYAETKKFDKVDQECKQLEAEIAKIKALIQ